MKSNIIYKSFLYLIILVISIFGSLFVFINSIDSSVFSNKNNPYLKNVINTTLPESFGFFTKSPKDKQLLIYKISEKNTIIKQSLKNNSRYNFYGLSRKSRRKIYELGTILRITPDSLWIKIKSDSLSTINLKRDPFLIKKNEKIKLIDKGKYIIYYFHPIIWEWNKLTKTTKGEYIYVQII